MTTIAISGHRPEKCKEDEVRVRFRRCWSEAKPEKVIYGGAAGVDLWAAHEAHLQSIPLVFAKPWTTHTARKGDEELYALLESVSEVHVVTEADTFPGAWCYHKRNEWMVDNATHVCAYWDGEESGGTFACWTYAGKVNVPRRNIYDWPPF